MIGDDLRDLLNRSQGTRQAIKEITKEMLRDYRFKKIMLAEAKLIFQDIPIAERKQLLKEAMLELLKSYRVTDIYARYLTRRREEQAARRAEKAAKQGRDKSP